MSKYQPTVTRKQLLDLAKRCIKAKSMRGVIRILKRFLGTLPQDTRRGTWYSEMRQLVASLRTGCPRYQIFAMNGNSKLPFAAFSTLPIVTCPGYGECGQWCYSLRAWRNPGAYCRQLQNTLLLLFNPAAVVNAFLSLPNDIDVRLYVDGDFESLDRVVFWMDLIRQRADLRVYGYSKSWAQLLEYDRNIGNWPANYVLNLSTGSKYDALPGWRDAMKRLPITRGDFVAVKIDDTGLPKGFKRYQSAEYHSRVRDALRAEYGKKTASCPGLCGSCGNKSQWCGDKQLVNLTIGIGIH